MTGKQPRPNPKKRQPQKQQPQKFKISYSYGLEVLKNLKTYKEVKKK